MEGDLSPEDIKPPTRQQVLASYQALVDHPPPKRQEWGLMCYLLNKDIVGPDGTVDNHYGTVFLLGSYSTKREADEEAHKLIEKTGVSRISAVRLHCPYPLLAQPQGESKSVNVDHKGKLIRMQEDEAKEEAKRWEEQRRIRESIIRDKDLETDPDTIEHFTHQVFLAWYSGNVAKQHREKMEEALSKQEKRLNLARDHYRRHPEHEQEWLPVLKKKLQERKEEHIYDALSAGYTSMRESIIQ